jgi:hypothetical protein
MSRLIEWYERLDGDRRVAALGEDKREGVLWVHAICKNWRACDELFDTLWEQG